ncbi:MAG TPA: hypothetical protein VL096_06845 [Pirellulaceae bacterium]|nr:hypothetical protein [Pirellulaceae bacterium]
MLRPSFTTALGGLLLAGMTLFVSTASAQECANCRGGQHSGGMGSVAYSGNPYGPGPYNCHGRNYPQPDLFYNFYAHGPCGGYPAQMYVAPKPVPANVGHTYITYQPFMPHEFMYKHHRTYHQYYDGGRGLTRAKMIAW